MFIYHLWLKLFDTKLSSLFIFCCVYNHCLLEDWLCQAECCELWTAENDPHDGKHKCEALWPSFKIAHQKSRYVFDLYHSRKEISKELYAFCLEQGYADKNLIAKWKKVGLGPFLVLMVFAALISCVQLGSLRLLVENIFIRIGRFLIRIMPIWFDLRSTQHVSVRWISDILYCKRIYHTYLSIQLIFNSLYIYLSGNDIFVVLYPHAIIWRL